jgi:hypothetical protein
MQTKMCKLYEFDIFCDETADVKYDILQYLLIFGLLLLSKVLKLMVQMKHFVSVAGSASIFKLPSKT